MAGAVLYLLLVSGKAPEGANEPEASQPEVAILEKYVDGSSNDLWETVDLARCELPAGAGEVVVLKLGGKGTAGDPYQVKTLGRPDGCPSLAFSVLTTWPNLSFRSRDRSPLSTNPVRTTVRRQVPSGRPAGSAAASVS